MESKAIKKSELLQFVPRPDRAVESRKKTQRNSEQIKQILKEKKKKNAFIERSERDVKKRAQRAEALRLLEKHRLRPEVRSLLHRTVDLGTTKKALHEDLTKKTSEVVEESEEEESTKTIAVHANSSSSVQRSLPTTLHDINRQMKQLKKSKKKNNIASKMSSSSSGVGDDASFRIILPSGGDSDSGDDATDEHKAKVVKREKPSINYRDEAREEEEETKPPLTTRAEKKIVIPLPNRLASESRDLLPVTLMQQEIMEAITENAFVLLSGETGSGKTTQVPQFLVESGFGSSESEFHSGMVCVTQPRRVAAIAMAERVGIELGERDWVGYQVKNDAATVSRATRIKFVTDGVLLREAKQDILLRKYSAIIVDEAHERGINTDLIIGMLSRVVPLRQKLFEEGGKVFPLKVVIMSATMALADFERVPLAPRKHLTVEGRQFPVHLHFAKQTEEADYLRACLRKATQVHKKLPTGHLLVFLPGEREIAWMVAQLRGSGEAGEGWTDDITLAGGLGEEEEEEEETPLDVELNDEPVAKRAKGSNAEEENKPSSIPSKMRVLPLFSKLPQAHQRRVFESCPSDTRLIVVATNIAETSLTIPNVRYVIDCGREKRKVHDQVTGTSSYRVDWISKASAAQRVSFSRCAFVRLTRKRLGARGGLDRGTATAFTPLLSSRTRSQIVPPPRSPASTSTTL